MEVVADGPSAVQPLANELIVIGSELMDLYFGRLAPADLGAKVIDALDTELRFDLANYRDWITEAGGYRTIDLAADGSRWVLRLGDESGRYVHVHPGRWSPQTCRVRANVLKTAIVTLAHVGIYGGDPFDVALVNRVRRDYLNLAPMGRDLSGDQGIGAAMNLLNNRE